MDRRYKIRVKHDNGYVSLTVAAPTLIDAFYYVMMLEGCPRSAIISGRRTRAK